MGWTIDLRGAKEGLLSEGDHIVHKAVDIDYFLN